MKPEYDADLNALCSDIQQSLECNLASTVAPLSPSQLEKLFRRFRTLTTNTVAASLAILIGLVGTSAFAVVVNQDQKEDGKQTSDPVELLAKRNAKLANVLIDEDRHSESLPYLTQIPEHLRGFEFGLLQHRAQGGLLTYYPKSIEESIETALMSRMWAIGSDHQSLNMIRYTDRFEAVNQPLDDQEPTLLFQPSTDEGDPISFDHSGNLLVVGTPENQINVIDLLKDKNILTVTEDKEGYASEFTFSQNARYLAWRSGLMDTTFKVIDLTTGETVFIHVDETDYPLPNQFDDSGEQDVVDPIPSAPELPENNGDSEMPPLPEETSDELAPNIEEEFNNDEGEFEQDFSENPAGAAAQLPGAAEIVLQDTLNTFFDDFTEAFAEGIGNALDNALSALHDDFQDMFTLDFDPIPNSIAVADNGDRTLIAITTKAETIQVWDIKTKSMVFESPLFEANITANEISPDTTHLFIALDDSTLRIVSLENPTDYQIVRIPNGTPCSTITFADNGSFCLLGSYGGNIYRYNCTANEITASFSGHNRAVSMIRIGTGNRLAASESLDGAIKFWEIAPEVQAPSLPRDVFTERAVTSTASFSADGRFLAIGNTSEGGVTLYNANDYSLSRSFFKSYPPVTHVKLSADGSKLAAAFQDVSCAVLDTQTGKIITRYTGPPADPNEEFSAPPPAERIESLDLSPDGQFLAMANQSELVFIDIKQNRIHARLNEDSWTAVTFDPIGSSLYAVKTQELLQSKLVQIDLKTRSEKLLTLLPRGYLGRAIYIGQPNELFIVQQRGNDYTSSDTIRLFNLDVLKEQSTIPTSQHLAASLSVAGANRILSGDALGNINMWDSKTGEEVFSMPLERTITGIALHPDINRFVVASEDGQWSEYFTDSTAQTQIIFTQSDTEKLIDVSKRWDEFYTETETGFNARKISDGSLLRSWVKPESDSERTKMYLVQSELKTYLIFDDTEQQTFQLWDFGLNRQLGQYKYTPSVEVSNQVIEYAIDEKGKSLLRSTGDSVELWDLTNTTKSTHTVEQPDRLVYPFFRDGEAFIYVNKFDSMNELEQLLLRLPSGEIVDDFDFEGYSVVLTTSPDGSQSLVLESDYLMLVDRKYFETPSGKARLMRMKYLLRDSD